MRLIIIYIISNRQMLTVLMYACETAHKGMDTTITGFTKREKQSRLHTIKK